MNSQMRLVLVVLAACTLGTACISEDDSLAEFCENASPAQKQAICGESSGSDGGTRPDGGTPDAGPPPACKLVSDCPAPSGPCLVSTCNGGVCGQAAKADGDVCTGTPTEQCRESAGTCKSGTCEYTRRVSGTCFDGNPCTEADTCTNSGTCVGTAKVCGTPPSQCHEPAGTCSIADGTCSYAFKSSTATCDDGDACTVNDRCDGAGGCAGERLSCNNPTSQCHEWSGTCSNNQCVYRLKAATATCNDGNNCTVGDVCGNNGACAGSLLSCNTPPGQCYEWSGTCASNQCVYRPKSSTSACDDGNACTEGEVCDGAGACVAGSPIVCPDLRQNCQLYLRCDPAAGCLYQDRCSEGEYCGEGICCPWPPPPAGPSLRCL